MKGHKEIDCLKKASEHKKNEKANVAEDNEDIVLMATSGCNEECTCGQKCQFNKKIKDALLLKDTALGCWVYNDDVPDDGNERNNRSEDEPENEIFDPNEQHEEADEFEEGQNINLQDLIPNDVIPLEFWSAINAEMERVLDRNNLLIVDAGIGNDQEREDSYEWPPLPEEHRTVENVAFVEMFRSGRIRTINITEQVTEAIKETNRDLIGAALAPHGLDMNDFRNFNRVQELQRETKREDDEETTAITCRENDEEQNEEEVHQEDLRIFGLGSNEDESKNEMSDSALITLNED